MSGVRCSLLLTILSLLSGLSGSMRSQEAADIEIDQSSRNFVRGLLVSVHLGGELAKNCGDELKAELIHLEEVSQALPDEITDLEEVMPFLKAVMKVVETTERPACLSGASEPMPPQLVQALSILGPSALAGPALGETVAFVKTCRKHIKARNFVAVGKSAGAWLLILASHAGGLPMLEGLAEQLNVAGSQVKSLASCADATENGVSIVKSLQEPLMLPTKVGNELTRSAIYAGRLEEVAQLMYYAQQTLQACLPVEFSQDDRLLNLKDGVRLITEMIESAEYLLGADLDTEFEALHGEAVAGDWKAVGRRIGGLVKKISPAKAGLKAMQNFFELLTGEHEVKDANPLIGLLVNVGTSVKTCMQASKTFIADVRASFEPLDHSLDESAKRRTALGRLKNLVNTTQITLQTCNSAPVKKIEALIRPEMIYMDLALNGALTRASSDTALLINGLDIADEVTSFIRAVDSHRTELAGRHLTKVLKLINDQVNMDSFLGSLLGTLDLGWDTLPACIGDVHRASDNLRIAATALSISPQKLTIDKGDCDTAMAALQQVTLISYSAADSCELQVKALKQLFVALGEHRWQIVTGQIMMFKENIAVRLWQLGKAVVQRDWASAGQQIAKLALLALDALDEMPVDEALDDNPLSLPRLRLPAPGPISWPWQKNRSRSGQNVHAGQKPAAKSERLLA